MRTVQRVIELLVENIEGLKGNPIHLEVQTFMPLNIELVGSGPRGMPVVAVMHFYEQHGDICRDPEVEFEVDKSGNWHPISYRQDSIGLKQEAVFLNPRFRKGHDSAEADQRSEPIHKDLGPQPD